MNREQRLLSFLPFGGKTSNGGRSLLHPMPIAARISSLAFRLRATYPEDQTTAELVSESSKLVKHLRGKRRRHLSFSKTSSKRPLLIEDEQPLAIEQPVFNPQPLVHNPFHPLMRPVFPYLARLSQAKSDDTQPERMSLAPDVLEGQETGTKCQHYKNMVETSLILPMTWKEEQNFNANTRTGALVEQFVVQNFHCPQCQDINWTKTSGDIPFCDAFCTTCNFRIEIKTALELNGNVSIKLNPSAALLLCDGEIFTNCDGVVIIMVDISPRGRRCTHYAHISQEELGKQIRNLIESSHYSQDGSVIVNPTWFSPLPRIKFI